MLPLDFSPLTDEREVRAFLDRVPLVVERERFARFVLGFPRHYLQATPPVEILRQFALVAALGRRSSASSLGREGSLWKLVVVASDRSFLFSRIAGTLSVFGADIAAAEAFGNTQAVVLDTFSVADTQRRFEQPEEGRRFQVFLEGVIDGSVDLERELEGRTPPHVGALGLEWDDVAHPSATRLCVSGADALGLLYAISRRLSEAGCSIEIAHIETSAGRIRDIFYLTAGGGKLSPEAKDAVERLLGQLGANAE